MPLGAAPCASPVLPLRAARRSTRSSVATAALTIPRGSYPASAWCRFARLNPPRPPPAASGAPPSPRTTSPIHRRHAIPLGCVGHVPQQRPSCPHVEVFPTQLLPGRVDPHLAAKARSVTAPAPLEFARRSAREYARTAASRRMGGVPASTGAWRTKAASSAAAGSYCSSAAVGMVAGASGVVAAERPCSDNGGRGAGVSRKVRRTSMRVVLGAPGRGGRWEVNVTVKHTL